ncbi:MAG: type II toxin-antitoxin system prevent-host-death family antitoxin [Gemmatimonadetes bacterium]|nr:type II toxin-antitoxin system prevent-host-death family antitoxin [Gemmatimonadota bacterium]
MQRPVSSEPEASTPPHPAWPLGRAKARFSEVVRLARSGQAQRVTVHGHDAVVIVGSTEFERLTARDISPSLRELVADSPLTRLVERRGGGRRFRAGDE